MSKKEIDDLKKLSKSLDSNLDDLSKMLENPKQYFEDHPIKEDWPDPPEFPTIESYMSAFRPNTSLKFKIRMLALVGKITHHQKRKTKEHPDYEAITDYKPHRKLEELIAEQLRKVGYQVRTQSNVSEWNQYKDNKDLHFGFDGLCLSEIPRIEGSNHDVTEFIEKEDGKIRNYEELVKAYQEAKGPEPTDFKELTEDLDETQTKMIKEFMESEDLTCEDISSVEESSFESEILEIDIFSRKYSMVESEEVAERIAFEQIDDDSEMQYFWKQWLEADESRTEGLEEYKQLVKDDGWQQQLSRYDGQSEETKSGFVYWRED